MLISKYKTSVSNLKDAERMLQLIEPFFDKAIINFDLKHVDKILSIQSPFEEYHPEIVVRILNTYWFTCTDFSNHPNHKK